MNLHELMRRPSPNSPNSQGSLIHLYILNSFELFLSFVVISLISPSTIPIFDKSDFKKNNGDLGKVTEIVSSRECKRNNETTRVVKILQSNPDNHRRSFNDLKSFHLNSKNRFYKVKF